MSTHAIVALALLALLIGWLALVFAGTWNQLQEDMSAETRRRENR